MKSFTSFLILFGLLLLNGGFVAVVDADTVDPDYCVELDGKTPMEAGYSCTFEDIVTMCGCIRLHSIDDSVYGFRKLEDHKVNVMDPVRKYWKKLQNPYSNVEGKDHPDVAIAYAFMHFLCFDQLIKDKEEHKIFECMRGVCPKNDMIEAYCEGMNGGGNPGPEAVEERDDSSDED